VGPARGELGLGAGFGVADDRFADGRVAGAALSETTVATTDDVAAVGEGGRLSSGLPGSVAPPQQATATSAEVASTFSRNLRSGETDWFIGALGIARRVHAQDQCFMIVRLIQPYRACAPAAGGESYRQVPVPGIGPEPVWAPGETACPVPSWAAGELIYGCRRSEEQAMRVEKAGVLDTQRISQAWEMYTAAFAELRAAAAQRHVMNRREFDEVMTDKRVAKYLAIDPVGERLIGLATFTNELDAMPLISPEFFAHRWPELYLARKVWYLGFFAVDRLHRGSGAFEAVIAAMWARVQEGGGVAALDVCGHNKQIGLPAAIQRTLEALTPQVVTEQVDVQTYWTFELAATD
jgi:hypothetical protein